MLTGATGELYMDADGRVHRRLPWAEFVNGAPTPLAPEDEADGTESMPGDSSDDGEWQNDDATLGGVL